LVPFNMILDQGDTKMLEILLDIKGLKNS